MSFILNNCQESFETICIGENAGIDEILACSKFADKIVEYYTKHFYGKNPFEDKECKECLIALIDHTIASIDKYNGFYNNFIEDAKEKINITNDDIDNALDEDNDNAEVYTFLIEMTHIRLAIAYEDYIAKSGKHNGIYYSTINSDAFFNTMLSDTNFESTYKTHTAEKSKNETKEPEKFKEANRFFDNVISKIFQIKES